MYNEKTNKEGGTMNETVRCHKCYSTIKKSESHTWAVPADARKYSNGLSVMILCNDTAACNAAINQRMAAEEAAEEAEINALMTA